MHDFEHTSRRGSRMLSLTEEQALVQAYLAGDAQAARQLISAHQPLAHKMATRYGRHGPLHEDLVQEAGLSMVVALRKFEPEKGYRFSTYAMWWIRAALSEYVRVNHSIIRLGTTAAQKKLFGGLAGAKATMNIYDDGVLSVEDAQRLAVHFGVDVDDVQEMNLRISPGGVTSLDARIRGESDGPSRIEHIADERQDPAVVSDQIDMWRQQTAMAGAVERLKPRHRDILSRRYLKEDAETLEDVSHVYGITRERVRQLEVEAIEAVKVLVGRAISTKRARRAIASLFEGPRATA